MTTAEQFNAELAAMNAALAPSEVDHAFEAARDALNELVRLHNDRHTGPEVARREAELWALANTVNFICSGIRLTADRTGHVPRLHLISNSNQIGRGE